MTDEEKTDAPPQESGEGETQPEPALSEAEKERLLKEEREKWEREQEEEKKREEEEAKKEEEIRKKLKKEGEKKGSFKLKAGIFILIGIAIVAAGWLTLSVNADLPPTAGAGYYYPAKYDVQFPQGRSVDFAGTTITAAGTGDRVILTVGGGLGQEMAKGEPRTIAEKRALVKIFGITLLDTNYKASLTFRGYLPSVNKNDFLLEVITQKDIPGFLLDMIIPQDVNAQRLSF
ncbi:MAG: hypothetical protein ACP5C4_09095 [Methanomicrobiales archaeon]